MPIRKIEKEHFVFIQYVRRGPADISSLRRHLDELGAPCASGSDIILDFSSSDSLASDEIEAIRKFVRTNETSSGRVRVVANPSISSQQGIAEAFKASNVAFYEDRRSFTRWLVGAGTAALG